MGSGTPISGESPAFPKEESHGKPVLEHYDDRYNSECHSCAIVIVIGSHIPSIVPKCAQGMLVNSIKNR